MNNVQQLRQSFARGEKCVALAKGTNMPAPTPVGQSGDEVVPSPRLEHVEHVEALPLPLVVPLQPKTPAVSSRKSVRAALEFTYDNNKVV